MEGSHERDRDCQMATSSVPTEQLPSVSGARPASRRSAVSSHGGKEDELDAVDGNEALAYAIEISYGEPQKPIPTTLIGHHMTLKRPFYETDTGIIEKAEVWQMLGLIEAEAEGLILC